MAGQRKLSKANPKPHFKIGKQHRKKCQCFSCRIHNGTNRADRILKLIEQAEREINGGGEKEGQSYSC